MDFTEASAMQSSQACKSCGDRTVFPDDETGNLVCFSCGVVQEFDNFQAHFGGITGPVGTYVRVGTAGSGNVYSYKETKVYEAQKLIEDVRLKLGLTEARSSEVKAMVERITEGEYGQGRWFTVFVGACAYVVMRKDSKTLPMVQVADVVGCDTCELGRMVNRVVNFLDLKLPEVDIVKLFKRSIATCPSFGEISEDVTEKLIKQGVFLVQCSMKWFLTTGRRPVPMVAAVLMFVAQVNQLEVKMEDVAKELNASIHTCKKRYKELLERLVKVAKALPWGKDVTVKNIIKNAPFVIQYMELKSMSKCGDQGVMEHCGIDLDDVFSDCLNNGMCYAFDTYNETENDSQYFKVKDSQTQRTEVPNDLSISHECLAMLYSKYLNEAPAVSTSVKPGDSNKRISKRGYDPNACVEWWRGKSRLSKELLLKEILEEDVGLDANPPSFDRGQLDYRMRREKIKAAKLRIERIIKCPSESGSANSDVTFSKCVNNGEKRRKIQGDINWEDFIIETLLLHQVGEDEIEKGYYKALLDLHVFYQCNSESSNKLLKSITRDKKLAK